MTQHISVLQDAVLAALLPAARFIDGTLGAGGHTKALLDAGAGEGLGLDADPMALAIANERLQDYQAAGRVHTAHASYLQMGVEMERLGWDGVDAILLDLGLSSMQLDTAERGFAFRHDGPLDMRFNPIGDAPTAAELVNYLDESELAQIFYKYGEEPQGRRFAKAIVQGRPFETTAQLAQAIEQASPRRQKDRIHPATRVFQALRIAVNNELDAVEQILPLAISLLKPGGRLAVISFHSLEDRIVKQQFKDASLDCICPPQIPICVCDHRAKVRLVTRKPQLATAAEIADNPRSRSAKLRVVEKLSS